MRLTQLVEQLALKFTPDAVNGDELSASAARTALVAQITALDAARAGSVGRGLQLAAEELHELALLTGSQDKNIRSLGADAQRLVEQVRALCNDLALQRWSSVEALRPELKRVKEEISLLICELVRKISAMPQSLGDYEAPQSADRVQIETLLRQAIINGRDRLTAIEIVLEALIASSGSCQDLEQLALLDSESLDYSVRQRLAGLTRDQALDEQILSKRSSH
ncbi:MAG: hypothetical protein ACPGSC_01450 [Granulosicoccaceae bacterium]